MSNIRNTNYKRLDARLNYSGLYDFSLVFNDGLSVCDNVSYDNYNHLCLVAWFDFNKSFVYTNNIISLENSDKIYSIRSWDNKIVPNEGLIIPNFGLTGIDNGSIKFKLPLTSECINDEDSLLYQTLTNSNLVIDGVKKKHFTMNKVSTYDDEFTMDVDIEKNEEYPNVGYYATFKGGFYQGFYKLDGYDYQTLPNRYENGFTINLWVYKSDDILSGEETLINDKYPNNKGFFLYFGTRAENKFWSEFKGKNTICPDTKKELFTQAKENSFEIQTDEGVATLNENIIPKRVIENQFLIYGRGLGKVDGLGKYTPSSLNGAKTVTVDGIKDPVSLPTNPFLLYGRSNGTTLCCPCDTPIKDRQWTACDKKGLESEPEEYVKDVNADIVDNAFGFRITDLGQIQYRYITKNTDGEIIIREDQTSESIVLDNEWTNITLRWLPDNYLMEDDECENGAPRYGKLLVYINCYLKYSFRNFPEIIGKRLNEIHQKQVGVPYNISLGGGTLGLGKHVTFDGPDERDLNLVLEENFAGTFIGGISQFKIYDCDLTWSHIRNICITEGPRYSKDSEYLIQEHVPEEFYIFLEDYGKIKL